MNQSFIELCAQIEEAPTTAERRLARRRLKKFATSVHPSFWDENHKSRWTALMKEEVPSARKLEINCKALFPVYVDLDGDSTPDAVLMRIFVREENIREHIIESDCTPEAEAYIKQVLSVLIPQNRSEKFIVSWSLEPEFNIALTEPLSGKSMGLALAVAVDSSLNGRIPKDDYIFTGEIDKGKNLKPIGSLSEKIQCVQQWRPNSLLIAPQQEGASEQTHCEGLANIKDVLAYIYTSPRNLDETLQLLQNVKDNYCTIHQGRHILKHLETLEGDEYEASVKLKMLLLMVPAYNHLGLAHEAIKSVEAVLEFMQTHNEKMGRYLNNLTWMHLIAHCGVSFLDILEIDRGLSLFELSPNILQEDTYKIHYQGSKASLLMAKGDLDEAKVLFEDNLRLCDSSIDCNKETVRTLTYYGNVLRLREEYEQAEAIFQRGLRLYNEHAARWDDKDNSSLPYIQWQYAKLLMDTGRGEEISDSIGSLRQDLQQQFDLAYPSEWGQREQNILLALKDKYAAHSKLYQLYALRCEAQYYALKHQTIPEDVLTKLRDLHPSWKHLSYREIWKRIPY